MVVHRYEDIISVENLLAAWREFLQGKRHKRDVEQFQSRLMDNIIDLHRDLKNKTYKHGGYQAFKINDPKPRDIHKATVRDRLLHHALYRVLYLYFDRTFIADSYSCRFAKGTHKAMERFRKFGNIVSKNNTRTCWILKCDIRKFFASIDRAVLLQILEKHLDHDTFLLLKEVIGSFYSTAEGKGLPLGNLTSQLLVNIYMNQFDHFIKERLKAKYYIRYADDFVIMHESQQKLGEFLLAIKDLLRKELCLELHPNKVFITTLASGIDFLGWIHFPDHRVLRASTKRRMFRQAQGLSLESSTIQSYLGMLRHGNAIGLEKRLVSRD